MVSSADTAAVVKAFVPDNFPTEIRSLDIGHINPSFIVRYRNGDSSGALFLQQINAHVFPKPESVIRNIRRVTEHLGAKLAQKKNPDADRKTLRLIFTHDNEPFTIDRSGQYWRAYQYIDNAYSVDNIDTVERAYAAAYAFGNFIRQLDDLPLPPLTETIADFHNTPKRFENFMDALERDPLNRAARVKDQIDFAQSRESSTRIVSDIQDNGKLVLRSVHNDTKINNVLFDAKTHEALCVVDLDTVMPGLIAHDFGDLVRSCISDTPGDSSDLNRIELRMPVFAALVEGYLASIGGLLSADEIDSLVFGARVITLELGLRFLTDYLEGDRYFRAKRSDQNLDRARVQFRLVELMERHEEEMWAEFLRATQLCGM